MKVRRGSGSIESSICRSHLEPLPQTSETGAGQLPSLSGSPSLATSVSSSATLWLGPGGIEWVCAACLYSRRNSSIAIRIASMVESGCVTNRRTSTGFLESGWRQVIERRGVSGAPCPPSFARRELRRATGLPAVARLDSDARRLVRPGRLELATSWFVG